MSQTPSTSTAPSNVTSIASRQGKHAAPMNGHTSYSEYRAKSNPARRHLIEKDRLEAGMARHRVHRLILSSQPPADAA